MELDLPGVELAVVAVRVHDDTDDLLAAVANGLQVPGTDALPVVHAIAFAAHRSGVVDHDHDPVAWDARDRLLNLCRRDGRRDLQHVTRLKRVGAHHRLAVDDDKFVAVMAATTVVLAVLLGELAAPLHCTRREFGLIGDHDRLPRDTLSRRDRDDELALLHGVGRELLLRQGRGHLATARLDMTEHGRISDGRLGRRRVVCDCPVGQTDQQGEEPADQDRQHGQPRRLLAAGGEAVVPVANARDLG